MAVGIHQTPWATKPPMGARIDYSSPLAAGIIFCTPLNETGGAPSELMTGRISTPGIAPTWTYGQKGPALNAAATINVENFQFANDARYVPTPSELTIAAVSFPITLATDTINAIISCNGAFSMHYESFAGHGFAGFALANWSGGNENIRYLNVDPSVNAWHVFVGVITGSSPSAIYLDGVSKATSTTSAVSAQVLTNPVYILGNGVAGVKSTLKGRHELIVMWNRALTAAEIVQFTANPYQIFAPRRSYFNTAALAASSSNLLTMGCG